MRLHSVIASSAREETIEGRVLCHNVGRPHGTGFAFRKGQRLRGTDLPDIQELGEAVLHLIELEPGDLHEEQAGLRIAQAVAGAGVRIKGYVGAQYHLVAEHRGLLRVDVTVLYRLNSQEGVAVFTAMDCQPVDEGELVAGVKVTPLVVPESVVRQAEETCGESSPVQVLRFRPCRVAALVLEKIDSSARRRFQTALEKKLQWYGSELTTLRQVDNSVPAFSSELRRLVEEGVDVVLTAGASSLDPLEPLFISLHEVGARIEKHGAPVHPGSLFWLARLQEVPIFGLSSCEMFSHRTVLDLVLCRVLAGVPVRREDLAALGHGGLLERVGDFRFPRYGG